MTVSPGWNAGALRARLLGTLRLGSAGRRDLAYAASLERALATLQASPYGHDVRKDMTLSAAHRAVAATPLWHLRVLAGWLPPVGAELARRLAAWWEVLNVEDLLAGFAGAAQHPPYELGRLDTAWRHLRDARTPEAVRERLAASPWRDPGADDAAAIVTWLRLAWAQRVNEATEAAARIAAGWAALVAARHLLLGGRAAEVALANARLLGHRWIEAGDLTSLRERLPRDAAWVLDGVDSAGEIWRAEVRWWRALDADGQRLLHRPRSGADAVVGAFAVLLADAHGVQGALELAARTGRQDEVIGETL